MFIFYKHNYNVIIIPENMIKYPNSAQVSPDGSFKKKKLFFDLRQILNKIHALQLLDLSQVFLIYKFHLYLSFSFGRKLGGGWNLEIYMLRKPRSLSCRDSHCLGFVVYNPVMSFNISLCWSYIL